MCCNFREICIVQSQNWSGVQYTLKRKDGTQIVTDCSSQTENRVFSGVHYPCIDISQNANYYLQNILHGKTIHKIAFKCNLSKAEEIKAYFLHLPHHIIV